MIKAGTNRVTTALLLAAGTGSRLHPMTHDAPKCLTEINGQSFIQRLVHALRANGIYKLVVVVGHLDHCIREFLDTQSGLTVEYIENPKYQTTNNIYSLWLARERIREPFLLVECDLIFHPDMLASMLDPDKIAISHRLPWMNGTTVSIDSRNRVTEFHTGEESAGNDNFFKTVNIYSFSATTWERVSDKLKQHVSNDKCSGYYETVLADLVNEGNLSLEGVFFDPKRWYEVDCLEDLRQAEKLFPRCLETI